MEVFWFIVFLFLLVILFGALPTWPYTEEREWGYAPSAIAFVLLLLFLVLFWFGIIAVWWPWAVYY
jgi:hypothetical protein